MADSGVVVKKAEYRFELGALAFSVEAASEEDAERQANEFVGSLSEVVELDSLESRTVFNVRLYPQYSAGLSLVDIEDIDN